MDPRRSTGGRESGPVSGDAVVVNGILAHLDAAYNLASWLVGGEHDAQDIVQEACLKAMRSAGAFRGGDLRSWVLTIVRNACFDWLRRQKIAREDELDEEMPVTAVGAESDPARILQRKEDVQRMRGAIEQLPAMIREVVVLREMEGLSYKEIAAVSGVLIGTVMSRLARARSRLAQILSDDPAMTAQRSKP